MVLISFSLLVGMFLFLVFAALKVNHFFNAARGFVVRCPVLDQAPVPVHNLVNLLAALIAPPRQSRGSASAFGSNSFRLTLQLLLLDVGQQIRQGPTDALAKPHRLGEVRDSVDVGSTQAEHFANRGNVQKFVGEGVVCHSESLSVIGKIDSQGKKKRDHEMWLG